MTKCTRKLKDLSPEKIMNILNSRSPNIAEHIYKHLLNNPIDGKMFQNENTIENTIDLNEIEKYSGMIYAIIVKKYNRKGIIYIGKDCKKSRLRQHLTNKNKNGEILKKSVKTKHKDIINIINEQYTVTVSLYSKKYLSKSILSYLEILIAEYSKKEFKNIFNNDIDHWNKRIG